MLIAVFSISVCGSVLNVISILSIISVVKYKTLNNQGKANQTNNQILCQWRKKVKSTQLTNAPERLASCSHLHWLTPPTRNLQDNTKEHRKTQEAWPRQWAVTPMMKWMYFSGNALQTATRNLPAARSDSVLSKTCHYSTCFTSKHDTNSDARHWKKGETVNH